MEKCCHVVVGFEVSHCNFSLGGESGGKNLQPLVLNILIVATNFKILNKKDAQLESTNSFSHGEGDSFSHLSHSGLDRHLGFV